MPGAGPPGPEARAGAGPAGAGQGALDAGFRQPAIKSLASIICVAYREREIVDLFRSSGFAEVWDYPSADWRFLCAALESAQRDFGPYGVAKILEAVCQQEEPGNGGVREDINGCLRPCGVEIGDDCRARRLGEEGAPAGRAALFDQRRHHPFVIEHAKPKFLRGDHFGAVVEACKALEDLVSERSGVEDYGVRLMKRALGDSGTLEVDMADLTGNTKDGIRRGVGSMCKGVVSSVRNPVSHEYEQRFPISGADALDILGVISYLCRQVERMRRKTGPPPAPPGGGGGDPGMPWARVLGAQGWPGGMDLPVPAIRPGKTPEVRGLAVRPETVEAGGTVDVTVTGTDIGEWYVWVCAEDGTVKSIPTPLEARDPDASTEGGVKRYAFSVITVNYDPGEYRVSVSVTDDMSAYVVRIKKFMVTPRRPAVSGGGKTAGTL